MQLLFPGLKCVHNPNKRGSKIGPRYDGPQIPYYEQSK